MKTPNPLNRETDMNVYDDLICELKAENLLEQDQVPTSTPIPNHGAKSAAAPVAAIRGSQVTTRSAERPHLQFTDDDGSYSSNAHIVSAPEFSGAGEMANVELEIAVDDEVALVDDLPEFEKPEDESEFFRRRAMEEVGSLQLVEHLFSNVEREYMRVVPEVFNDLEVKKALHRFLQVSGNTDSSEHAEAEFLLMQETESWNAALCERNEHISVAAIRQFCENSRPALSSQALISLSRFYRNAPYTEDVRAKFDFVMTKLFTRDIGGQKRKLLFGHNDMIAHIQTLYENWSSILLYSKAEHSEAVLASTGEFKAFAKEAEEARSFDQLLEVGFFDRVKNYKEALGELFYVPEVAAEVMDCNVRIGNRYVDLIEREKMAFDNASLQEKYGLADDLLISAATGKTLRLVELLEQTTDDGPYEETTAEEQPAATPIARTATTIDIEKVPSFFTIDVAGVNRWLLAATLLVVLSCIGLFLWSERSAETAVATPAKTIQLTNAELAQQIGVVRATGQTLYAVMKPSFEELSEDQRRALLEKTSLFAKEKGLSRVELINRKGKTVGFASGERMELFTPTEK